MRDRTADLKLAKLPLSQLSYVPKNFGRPASGSFKDRFLPPSKLVVRDRVELPTFSV